MTTTPLRLLKDRGLCKNEPIELFYPTYDAPSSTAKARAICERCPVRPECLEWALEHKEEGVWGGTSEATRRSLERARSRTKCVGCESPNIAKIKGQSREVCLDCALSWAV